MPSQGYGVNEHDITQQHHDPQDLSPILDQPMTRIEPDIQNDAPTHVAPSDEVWTLTLEDNGQAIHSTTAWTDKAGVHSHHWDIYSDDVEVEQMTMREFLERHYEENPPMNPFYKVNRLEWLQEYMESHDLSKDAIN